MKKYKIEMTLGVGFAGETQKDTAEFECHPEELESEAEFRLENFISNHVDAGWTVISESDSQ